MKESILKDIFYYLSKEEILDVLEILKGYNHRLNKSKKDTLLARCMFASGFHNTKEFLDKYHLTKDNALGEALSNNVYSIKALNKLRNIFDIDDSMLRRIIEEIGSDK